MRATRASRLLLRLAAARKGARRHSSPSPSWLPRPQCGAADAEDVCASERSSHAMSIVMSAASRAAATAGLGALTALLARWLLPDLSTFGALGETEPSALAGGAVTAGAL